MHVLSIDESVEVLVDKDVCNDVNKILDVKLLASFVELWLEDSWILLVWVAPAESLVEALAKIDEYILEEIGVVVDNSWEWAVTEGVKLVAVDDRVDIGLLEIIVVPVDRVFGRFVDKRIPFVERPSMS